MSACRSAGAAVELDILAVKSLEFSEKIAGKKGAVIQSGLCLQLGGQEILRAFQHRRPDIHTLGPQSYGQAKAFTDLLLERSRLLQSSALLWQ